MNEVKLGRECPHIFANINGGVYKIYRSRGLSEFRAIHREETYVFQLDWQNRRLVISNILYSLPGLEHWSCRGLSSVPYSENEAVLKKLADAVVNAGWYPDLD